MSPEAFFLPLADGQRFCLLHAPHGAARGGIVYFHPFAEEMNRARAVVARQARAFAAAGYAVLQIDLQGCGDSSGDFGDARWSQWQQDGLAAVQLLQARFAVPVCLWGLRSGALLAATVAEQLAEASPLLLWQPVLSGRQHVQQFLRLGFAAELLEGKASGGTGALQAQLDAGQSVEVAGYTLSPTLASELTAAELRPSSQTLCIEIDPAGSALSPVLRRFADATGAQASTCADAQCWLTPGILACPQLEAMSLSAMERLLP